MNNDNQGECGGMNGAAATEFLCGFISPRHPTKVFGFTYYVRRSHKPNCGWLVALSIWIAMQSTGLCAEGSYTRAMFIEGLKKGGFVLINLRDSSAQVPKTVCVRANLLLGAIHMQYGLDYDEKGNRRAFEIALAAKNRTFLFTHKDAYDNVKPEYISEQLSEVRRQLSRLTRSEMKKQVSDPYGQIHAIYAQPSRHSYHDAVAHVLLQNGILIGADDRTDMLMPLQN